MENQLSDILSAGLTVESEDNGVNGCVVTSLAPSGAIFKDGRVQVGDYVVAINNESLRHVTSAQARAILRRSALQSEISIQYIPSTDALIHKETAKLVQQADTDHNDSGTSQSSSTMLSPRSVPPFSLPPFHLDHPLSPLHVF